jgi:hypothetical protein
VCEKIGLGAGFHELFAVYQIESENGNSILSNLGGVRERERERENLDTIIIIVFQLQIIAYPRCLDPNQAIGGLVDDFGVDADKVIKFLFKKKVFLK